uniref:hypothetical protein n=1 Tax=Paractinoplanes polyasparticus TaxID=2856853 RepID=UPI001C84801A|nr:hypothetical protein [Actinoplanes polyasparticus]
MAFWNKSEEDALRDAWKVLDRSNVSYDATSNSYEVTGGDSQRLSRKTCEAFDILRDKGFLELEESRFSGAHSVLQSRAGIDWFYA